MTVTKEDLEKGIKNVEAASSGGHQSIASADSEPVNTVLTTNLPIGWDADTAVFLAVSILIFGVVVFIGMVVLLRKGSRPEEVLKICALPLVIIGAIFLVVIGYSQQQIAPVLSLLSAIAGYLLGSNTTNSNQADSQEMANKLIQKTGKPAADRGVIHKP